MGYLGSGDSGRVSFGTGGQTRIREAVLMFSVLYPEKEIVANLFYPLGFEKKNATVPIIS